MTIAPAPAEVEWPVGLRATRATRTLAALCRARPGARWSEADVERALQRCGVQVNRVTVYRLLDRFTRAGWLVRLVDSDRTTRYVAQPPVRARAPEVQPPAGVLAAACVQCHAPLQVPVMAASVQEALQTLQAALASLPQAGASWEVALQGTCVNCQLPARSRTL